MWSQSNGPQSLNNYFTANTQRAITTLVVPSSVLSIKYHIVKNKKENKNVNPVKYEVNYACNMEATASPLLFLVAGNKKKTTPSPNLSSVIIMITCNSNIKDQKSQITKIIIINKIFISSLLYICKYKDKPSPILTFTHPNWIKWNVRSLPIHNTHTSETNKPYSTRLWQSPPPKRG